VITLEQYFGNKPHTKDHESAAKNLLARVNLLISEAIKVNAIDVLIDVDTGTEISGSKGGAGDGGFRLSSATTGRSFSSHKEAAGVDKYDPLNRLDKWLDKFEDGNGGNSKLKEFGLYREHPSATIGWCHLTTRAPKSGRRTFYP
jgi:hypothetical protein